MTRVIHSLWPWTPDSGCAASAEPDVVTGLTATPSGTTTINLVWDADSTASPNQASSYDIERSNDGSTGWSVIATVAAPAVSYSDTTLSASTTRHYRIVAKNCADVANASTSASATTAAGSIGPSWSLDFSTGTPSGYTLTRASSGTFVDSSGYIASAATDVARLTHDKNGNRLGLLIEPSRTNVALRSEEISNTATWIRIEATAVANAATAPDNASTAERLREESPNGRQILYHSGLTLSTTSPWTFSIYVKKDTRDYFVMQINFSADRYSAIFNVSSGTVEDTKTTGTITNAASSIVDAGNGWYRCIITAQGASGASSFPQIGLSDRATFTGSLSSDIPTYAGSNTNAVYVWGAQIENASKPSSYIATTNASVTRSADLVHVLDSAITNWGDPGALVVHFYPPLNSGTLISTDDASTAQVGIEASTTTAARAFWSSGSTSTGTIGSGVQKAVHSWNGSTSKFCINGGTVQSGTNNLTIGNTDFVTLGAEATESGGVPGTFSQYANCVIRKVEFYSGTLTDANLQTITT